jgi:hypothetical protein
VRSKPPVSTTVSASFDGRRHRHPHATAGGEHVHRAVLVSRQVDAVAAGRLGQPVHLLTEGEKLATCLSEGVDQLGVALGQLAHPLGRLSEALFEQPDVSWGLRQLAPQQCDLVLEEPDLRGQFGATRTVVQLATLIGLAAGTVGRHIGTLLPLYVFPRYRRSLTSERTSGRALVAKRPRNARSAG